MANLKSAAKRARQSIRKRAFNGQTVSSVKTIEKQVRKAIAAKDATGAQKLLREFKSKIDKAASKGVFHARHASRKISRISSQISRLTP